MRAFVVVTMLIACLVYGFMPARAGVVMEAVQVSVAHHDHADHHGMETAGTHGNHGGAHSRNDPCPHSGLPGCGTFCAACLAIVPVVDAGREGHPPFSWPEPLPTRKLADAAPAPAEPPPRA
ncbi:hypothetical protein NOF55_16310 [Rhizobiaceae bacterium BDR2-2]|uniref:DUF2946 domain-containing protein n=1 Tax=Ectorhizobium quercum TaxID=2965071 RepID=A0AAE3MWJ8_9HYPH|nr:hypothetical protein [Ectorhizobium quercum]MCX8996283.1 hypothetical protein [Ectorhizobium quercum]MCX8998678.1 hypothetical protein [Ectorhizobium quercum]